MDRPVATAHNRRTGGAGGCTVRRHRGVIATAGTVGAMFDVKIVGGNGVDGTGADRFVGGVAVKDGKREAVKRGGGLEGKAAETVDAAGKLVTPGFVDIHTHYDGQAT